MSFDPLNSLDRTQNAHLLLFGPTGAGKSATLCSALSQLMAVHRPRLFIAEAGNSFGLLVEYFRGAGAERKCTEYQTWLRYFFTDVC